MLRPSHRPQPRPIPTLAGPARGGPRLPRGCGRHHRGQTCG